MTLVKKKLHHKECQNIVFLTVSCNKWTSHIFLFFRVWTAIKIFWFILILKNQAEDFWIHPWAAKNLGICKIYLLTDSGGQTLIYLFISSLFAVVLSPCYYVVKKGAAIIKLQQRNPLRAIIRILWCCCSVAGWRESGAFSCETPNSLATSLLYKHSV